jgi:hypothetical protein
LVASQIAGPSNPWVCIAHFISFIFRIYSLFEKLQNTLNKKNFINSE